MKRALRTACQQALEQLFDVPGYRPGQKAAASCLLSGRDLLCILPTGAGKSLCWQLPAVVHEGLTVVISPLIALMQDQVAGLTRRGIPAVTLNSLMDPAAQAEAERQIRTGETRILFISPERLDSPGMLLLLQEVTPWLLVVDEAHCVVQWGESFRQSYSRIGECLRELPRRPVVCAMTATADARMQRHIASSLGMRWHKRVMLSVVRENLIYTLRTTANASREVLRLTTRHPRRTVVFCRTRKRTEQLAGMLRRAGVSAGYYHAGMDRQAREAAQEDFSNGRTQVLVATTAFGMGVDIPDIRCVIHDYLPGSITDLVQQSGRAGRDGQEAECVILLSADDLKMLRVMMASRQREMKGHPIAKIRWWIKEWGPMRRLLQLLLGGGCIQVGIAASFGQMARRCGHCSACATMPEPVSVPNLPRMRAGDLLLWLLLWQRAALARKRGVKPSQVISRGTLTRLSRGEMPPDALDNDTLRPFLPLLQGHKI